MAPVPLILAGRLLSTGDTRTVCRFVCVVTNLLVGIAFGAYSCFPAYQALNPDMEVMLSCFGWYLRFNGCDPTFERFSPDQHPPTDANTRKRRNICHSP